MGGSSLDEIPAGRAEKKERKYENGFERAYRMAVQSQDFELALGMRKKLNGKKIVYASSRRKGIVMDHSDVFLVLSEMIRKSAEVEYPSVPTLKLRCLIVSFALFDCSRKLGITGAKLIGGWYRFEPPPTGRPVFGDQSWIQVAKMYRDEKDRHAWVEYDEKIWDLTRTQYGNFPDVSIATVPNPHYIADCISMDGELVRHLLQSCGNDGPGEAFRISSRVIAEFGALGGIRTRNQGA